MQYPRIRHSWLLTAFRLYIYAEVENEECCPKRDQRRQSILHRGEGYRFNSVRPDVANWECFLKETKVRDDYQSLQVGASLPPKAIRQYPSFLSIYNLMKSSIYVTNKFSYFSKRWHSEKMNAQERSARWNSSIRRKSVLAFQQVSKLIIEPV